MAVVEDLTEDERYLFALLNDPSGIDLAEFCWTDPERDSNCWRAWPFQWDWWHTTDKLQIDQCARALDVNTLIPVPDGWMKMGELCPGDTVFNEQGHPVCVLEVSEVWDDRECFEVCFDDHTSIVADGAHLWLTWDKKARQARNPNRRGIAKPGVRSTRFIAETLKYGSENNHAIDVTRPLAGDGDVLLDPYYVGYWLGDGTSASSEITTEDEWVLRELERRGFELVPRSAHLRWGVRYPHPHNRKTESVQADLRRLGVLFDKHIPNSFLRASERVRRDLLAGFVDADGHMQKNGSCEVTQKNQRLAEDLLELLRSLGEKPRMTKRTAYMDGVDCGPAYRVTWRPRMNPALLPRKAACFVASSTEKEAALGQRRVVDVRPVPSRPVRCITVEGASQLFLAGEGMIPTHNSVGKSTSIKVRAFAFPFQHPKQEMVITAPELVHLNPIIGLVENQFMECRLGRSMLPSGKNHGITHRPFEMNFLNGARIFGRIPQRDGKGMKGIHPLVLELDEGQDFPEPGYIEVIETMKSGSKGAGWRIHGVTRGVRDFFFKFTQPDSGWTVHRFSAMYRPDWTDQERQEKTEMYGHRDHPDYRRNILGLHGDATSPLFVMSRLMACVDQDQMSNYNASEYMSYRLRSEQLDDMDGDIESFLDFPASHRKGKAKFWAGMDVGYTDHPSEILVFRQEEVKGKPSVLRLVTRIHLERIGVGQQATAIAHVMRSYNVEAFAMDKTGNGLPLFQLVQENNPDIAEKVKGYNFSGNILVDFDETIEFDPDLDDEISKRGIKRKVLEYSSDKARELVDAGRLVLPYDKELIGEFQGQTYVVTKSAMDAYGRKTYNKGSFHALDAFRMMILAFIQNPIEELTKEKVEGPVLDLFFG